MSPLARLFSALIRFYQLAVAPLLPPSCRFAPSCSSYALEAVASHGALKGGVLAAQRICRCHPWGGSGFDPVPPARPGCGHTHHLHG
jgi:putative membrane protein insertion efficiency factor